MQDVSSRDDPVWSYKQKLKVKQFSGKDFTDTVITGDSAAIIE